MKSCCTCFCEQKCPVGGTAGPGIPNPGLKTAVRVKENVGDIKTFLLHEKSNCGAVGSDVRMCPKAHARIWGVFSS